ncbi:hypothetical protein FEF65_11385 [Mariprofundus erugo]|uniref:Uncharacterized protein n=1 Tax=Mariprofundus erugo TaxID=2528639 RepID=A0A5R9GM53_9PROT|nr:hypothetical protein [Mariprofundus erugo]TLS66185.1 hypothetical protein FEF65_11385 [Mariprofundus erugo]
MAFLSISIDICGSTEAKAKLRKHAELIATEPTRLYEEFQRQVLRVEETFWTLLRSEGLEIERLFLIKTIGDELWYSYDLEGLHDFEVHAAMAKVINALVGMHTKSFDLVAAPDRDPNDWENIDPSTLLRIGLPLKITVDQISDALEMNALREKYLKSHVASLLSPPERPGERLVQEGDPDFNDLCNRLGIAHRVVTSNKVHTTIRSDFIGWEVDRFFRLTKEAMENAVLVGPEILEAFDTHKLIALDGPKTIFPDGSWEISEGFFYVCISAQSRTSTGKVMIARKNVSADKLKGIGEDCPVALVYSKYL